MKQVRLFSCCFISVVMLLHIALALPVKQGGLRKKLDDLEIETQEQNIQRRKEIKELYTMMESLEERLNNTSPIVDTSGDITDATHMSTGAVHVAVDEQRIAKVLKEFVRLKQGMRDEKRLAVDLRAQVGELNITLGQLISQSGQAMDAVNRSFGEVNTKIQTTVLGQDQLKTVVSAIQDDLERQADETGRLIMNLEIELQDLSRSVVHKISSCVEHMKHGKTMSGVYDIALPNPSSVKVKVYCDQNTDGGGWTVFQRRQDGSVDFYRSWNDYREGFGDLEGEFWLGNDKLHMLLALQDNHELRIDMVDHDDNIIYAKYSRFMVASESQQYKLSVGGYSGTAGDAMYYHNGSRFSTKDRDNDRFSWHCAQEFRGGWWYKYCHHANLNGLYYVRDSTGVCWYDPSMYKVIYPKKVEMKFREKALK